MKIRSFSFNPRRSRLEAKLEMSERKVLGRDCFAGGGINQVRMLP